MQKYVLLHRALIDEGLIRPEDVVPIEEASWEEILRVHSPAYVEAIAHGTLDRQALRRLGFPWSEPLVRRSRLAVQGSIGGARLALEDGLAGNLAGGTHHAFPEHGEGFCVFNDVAVAIRSHQATGRIARALVVDLDVHQGNGTAAAFAGDESVFTFSMHGEKNFPFHKEVSSRDVNLPDGCDDGMYLALLDQHLPEVFDLSRPDLVIYLAGVDPAAGDRFGRMGLSEAGIEARDERVLETARRFGVPMVMVLAGGYASTPEKTAALHVLAYRAAKRVFPELF
jgi:acetoin utilization deacetylase AcuC-like enzyme